MLNWNKLQPYGTSKEKSFEQLCYQIANILYENDNNRITPIEDRGGGDGIEFYLTEASGQEWGWQAKYYEGSPRLNEHNRKASIIGSLKRALEVHPALVKWYLCIPMDFTPAEQKWFDETLPTHIPDGRIVKLVPWNQSHIHKMLNKPECYGLRNAFFNDLELSPDWFQNAFDNSFTLVKNKFDELLYIPDEEFEYWYLNPVLCNDGFRHRISAYPRQIQKLFYKQLQKFKSLEYTAKEFRSVMDIYRFEMSGFNDLYLEIKPTLDALMELCFPNNIKSQLSADFDDSVRKLQEFCNDGMEKIRPEMAAIFDGVTDEEVLKRRNNAYSELSSHHSECKKIIEEIKYFIRDARIPLKRQLAHYLGGGGAGKTNLCVAIAKSYLEKKQPVIFLPAVKLSGDTPLQDQILKIFDILSIYTFADFLDTINALGKIYNLRIPIIIDGLNEAITASGILNPKLNQDLPAIENEIKKRNNLVLITTCRATYQEAIWPGTSKLQDKRFIPLHGFSNYDEIKKLVRNYFDQYKIQAELSFISLKQFSKPIYLKIYCETANPQRSTLKEVTLGHDSIYSIFESFIEICDKQVYHKLVNWGKPPISTYKKAASKILLEIGEFLWNNPKRAILLQDIIALADPDGFTDFNKSVTNALLQEELLFMRDYQSGQEYIYLTYDLMSGYFIGKYLLESAPDFNALLKSEQLEMITSHEHLALYPHHDDIVDCLCALLPIHKQIFVHDLIADEQQTELWKQLFSSSIKATILLSPQYIPERQVQYISELITDQKNLISIFTMSEDVLFVTDHPFNFSFFEKTLRPMAMNERDISWTQYILDKGPKGQKELLAEFMRLQAKESHSTEQRKKTALVASYLMWTLTTTDENQKYEISTGLFHFGHKYPEDFFELVYSSLTINDPTIKATMLMIGYNLVLTLSRNRVGQPGQLFDDIVQQLQKSIFDKDSALSTNHILSREYAYMILQAISRKNPNLINAYTLTNIKKSFRTLGVTSWEVAPDKNKGQYREGNSLFHFHFEKENMYALCPKADQYKPSPLYKKRLGNLRWRAYQLGYDFEKFGESDKNIARRQGYAGDYEKIKRFADKYVYIAYQELCGYLKDRGKLNDSVDDGYIRLEMPSFEAKAAELRSETALPKSPYLDIDYIYEDKSLRQWCSDDSIPKYQHLLNTGQFLNKKGNWVLLRGKITQYKPDQERKFYLTINAVLVKARNLKLMTKHFSENQGPVTSIPFISNIHDAEIPDSDIIPQNEFLDWTYTAGTTPYTQRTHKSTFFRDGIPLSKKETQKLKQLIEKQTGIYDYSFEYIENFPQIIIMMKKEGTEKLLTPEEVIRQAGLEERIEIIEEVKYANDRKNIKVFHPVTSFMNEIHLCKNIIDFAGLERTSFSKDLYDVNEELASFNHTYESSKDNDEAFTYIRKDILDAYLNNHGLKMVYIVWGERDYWAHEDNWAKMDRMNRHRTSKNIYDFLIY
ncbi:ATP-binding protein [Pedobacter sp. GR22-10]|uniref:ATP-binding protein n=1 Tax=Pedobacter sp. GR22-10 TaxID=2994472 RepID=UPI002246DE43|nr:ATP-binding protein [Pedobacter sp. GR22-10]MCX2429624.1 ATP-binding protein [Pedobacter sp. GR22-10]